MSTIAHYDIPAEEFALAETFRSVPETSVIGEGTVACSDSSSLPLIWARTNDPQTFEDALAQDPTVVTATPIDDTGSPCLYRMEWSPHVPFVCKLLTHSNGTILDAAGSATGWQMRVLYPDHETLRTAHEACDDYNVSVDIPSIRPSDVDSHTHLGPSGALTEEQYEALAHAYNRGYFDVPRSIDLAGLAADLDISHQALSERLRRAHNTLIEEALELPLAEKESIRESEPVPKISHTTE